MNCKVSKKVTKYQKKGQFNDIKQIFDDDVDDDVLLYYEKRAGRVEAIGTIEAMEMVGQESNRSC